MNELLNYVDDPKNAEYNFALGINYEDSGHLAAAAGFYIRVTERSADDLLTYEALLRQANCLTHQGGRSYVAKGILLRAISLLPQRPEAYFLLSRLYEMNKEWQEAYAFAIMGQRLSHDHPRLRTNVDYPGDYGLVFEQAVAAWWIGLFEESIHLFRQLRKDPTMLPVHITAVENNLRNLENKVWYDPLVYSSSLYEQLRVKFPGARGIIRNYAQAYQDMFALTVLDGRRSGSFLELGSGDPVLGSNTKLLEEWGWNGISVDIDPLVVEKFAKERRSHIVTADATKLDYDGLLEGDYDYLQVDLGTPLDSLRALLRIPFEQHRFAAITFAHEDYYYAGIKERSRHYLSSHGYVLVVGDIAADQYNNFEDWWVHPGLIGAEIIERMRDARDCTKRADSYMLIGA